jgi:hypothetical protein
VNKLATERAIIHALTDMGKIGKDGNQYFLIPSEEDFKFAVEAILAYKTEHTVTTLEVKELMRATDFYVTQADVSNALTNFVDYGELIYANTETNGVQHRIFSSDLYLSQDELDNIAQVGAKAKKVATLVDLFLQKSNRTH